MPDLLEDMYPLSPLQRGMVFHTLQAPDTGVYVEQLVWEIAGDLDVERLAGAWATVVDRHPTLRTGFLCQSTDEPLQVVHTQAHPSVSLLDWGTGQGADHRALLDDLLAEDRRAGFQLSAPPLIRVTLISVAPGRHWMLWSFHHAILDGWSVGVLLLDLFGAYQAQGRSVPFRRPYRDFMAWLADDDTVPHERFWRARMAGFANPGRLPNGFRPEARNGFGTYESQLTEEETAALQGLARAHRLTVNTLAQGAWALLTSRYTGECDVVYGVTSSGRPAELAGIEDMIGLFIATTPMRVTVDDQPVLPWLEALQAAQAEARQHEHTSLSDIHGWSDVPPGQPLFESLLAFENYPIDFGAPQRVAGLELTMLRVEEQTNYPLTMALTTGKNLTARLVFDRSRFDEPWVSRLAAHFRRLMTGLLAEPARSLASVPMLSEEELAEQEGWNAAAASPPTMRLEQLFAAQAARSPEVMSVVSRGRRLTYDELDRRSLALSAVLAGAGAEPNAHIAVVMERGWEQVVAVLGIVRAGAAYLPVEPHWPRQRLWHVLERGECRLVVTQPWLADAIEWPPGVACVLVDDTPPGPGALGAHEASHSGEDLAYTIFTSGSTGEPKGVMIDHLGAVNTVVDVNRRFGVGPDDRVLALSALTFDLSVYDVFGTLAAGATIVMPGPSTGPDPAGWARCVAEERITIWNSVPAVLELLVDHAERSGADLSSLRLVLLSGDWIPVGLPDRVRALAADVDVISLGGATEASIWSICHRIGEIDPSWTSIPYGRPLGGQSFRILDRDLRPVPVGMAGELFIGGLGVARGYWRDAERTAASFVAHPATGERLYRTGDLGRYGRDGVIEFLGRKDGQVKLRGFRVELGEIEVNLVRHPSVSEAVVVLHDAAGERRLVAYVVPAATAVTTSHLRELLAARLPEYMVPASFVTLSRLPLTPNGKVDRTALPPPPNTRPDLRVAYVAPVTAAETTLAEIWQDVLGVDRVGTDDNFFELGGDSLRTLTVMTRALKRGIRLSPADLFDTPTIAGLVRSLGFETSEQPDRRLRPAAASRRPELIPLSSAQEMIWVLNEMTPGTRAYISRGLAFDLTGALDADALEKAAGALVARHEAFRTTFVRTVQGVFQRVCPPTELELTRLDLSGYPRVTVEAELERIVATEGLAPFDPLAGSPLYRMFIVKLDAERHLWLLAMDHLVFDGWSQTTIARELGELYRSFVLGVPARLVDPPLDYADFVLWQRQRVYSEELEGHVAFWRDALADAPRTRIPADPQAGSPRGGTGTVLPVVVPSDVGRELRAVSRASGSTLFLTVVAALQVLVSAWVDDDRVAVTTVMAGRSEPELQDIVGTFTRPVRLHGDLSDASMAFDEFLGRVRDAAWRAFEHQDLPFSDLVDLYVGAGIAGTGGIAFEFDPMVDVLELPDPLGGRLVRGEPWFPKRTGTVDMPPVDMQWALREMPDGTLEGECLYRTSGLDPSSAEQLLAGYLAVLRAIADDPSRTLGDLRAIASPLQVVDAGAGCG